MVDNTRPDDFRSDFDLTDLEVEQEIEEIFQEFEKQDKDLHYPHMPRPNLLLRWIYRVIGRDLAFPLSGTLLASLGEKANECPDKKVKKELAKLKAAYKAVVKRNIAAGWVYGWWGNLKISLGYAKSGSCSDWQYDVYNALSAVKGVQCWEISKVRVIAHKAVVVYRKGTRYEWTGIFFDPWRNGDPDTYSFASWSAMFGVGNWRTN